MDGWLDDCSDSGGAGGVVPMSYSEAVGALEGALVFGIHPSLGGITELAESMGRPQDSFGAIQVTGTNGKTSTVRIIEALLRAEGERTGLYTSPHLERYPERFEVDGAVIGDDLFARSVGAVLAHADTLRPGAHGTSAGYTEFELLTAAALAIFRACRVDTAVLEVGMGGRWDATSVVAPRVAVITGVALDHTAVLGATREAIASEKGAIVRPDTVAVLGPGTVGVEGAILGAAAPGARVLAVRAGGEPSPVEECDTVRFSLLQRPSSPFHRTTVCVKRFGGADLVLSLRAPAYQAANIATAVTAAEAALGRTLRQGAASAALAGVVLPGRFEVVRESPPVVVDGSHNPEAAGVLARAIEDAWPDPAARPVVLLAVLADKDAEGIVRALAPVVRRIEVTESESMRALPVMELAKMVERITGRACTAHRTLRDALASGLAHDHFGLVVTGSLTTAGQARVLLRSDHPTA